MFYKRALHDKDIGHIFFVEFGDDLNEEEWQEHIELLVNFWYSVFIDKAAYNGDPYGPHFTIVDLKNEHFKPWVDLFIMTSDELYTAEIALHFKEKAYYYAKEFKHRLSLDTSTEGLSFL